MEGSILRAAQFNVFKMIREVILKLFLPRLPNIAKALAWKTIEYTLSRLACKTIENALSRLACKAIEYALSRLANRQKDLHANNRINTSDTSQQNQRVVWGGCEAPDYYSLTSPDFLDEVDLNLAVGQVTSVAVIRLHAVGWGDGP